MAFYAQTTIICGSGHYVLHSFDTKSQRDIFVNKSAGTRPIMRASIPKNDFEIFCIKKQFYDNGRRSASIEKWNISVDYKSLLKNRIASRNIHKFCG